MEFIILEANILRLPISSPQLPKLCLHQNHSKNTQRNQSRKTNQVGPISLIECGSGPISGETSNSHCYQICSDSIVTNNNNISNSSDKNNRKNSNNNESVVEVVAIGSSKDALLDFCLDSYFQSTLVRFWTVHAEDNLKAQLLKRSPGADVILMDIEGPLLVQSCPQAVILVASASYGSDHTTAIELLGAVKSTEGLAVAIVMKPFGFEGQRRLHEVEDLVDMLREQKFFCIVVDTDALLKEEVVTLTEALRSAHTAVLLAISSISILMSDLHPKFINSPHDSCKEVKVSEILTLLESYKEAEVGYGAGYNIKASISQAIFDCPFLTGNFKEWNGVVICTLMTATATNDGDVDSFMHVFRQTTGFSKEIIFSRVHEPALEQNLIVTTLLVLGCNNQKVSPKQSFLSNLASRIPFIFDFWKGDPPETLEARDAPSEASRTSNSGNLPISNPSGGSDLNLDIQNEELEIMLSNDYEDISSARIYNEAEESEVGAPLTKSDSSNPQYSQTGEGEPSFQREPLNSWSTGAGFNIARKWARERDARLGATTNVDALNHFTLPVGVKPSEQSTDDPQFTNSANSADLKNSYDLTGGRLENANVTNVTWDTLADVGFETLKEIRDAASTLLKGKNADSVTRKQGLLSSRAASMLKAERDTEKKWTPVREMKYRGGVYRGHCQGGLPEGKGRLTLEDGSFYDGTWRFGKRSGLGTLCYSNGDVFQGSWRDDLMHGKGWLYFHTGDRWFANFWKGKANGEGRFYSRYGNVFFGHFQDGWRHGRCLSIDVDGTRWDEVWDGGVLVSRNKLCDDVETSIE